MPEQDSWRETCTRWKVSFLSQQYTLSIDVNSVCLDTPSSSLRDHFPTINFTLQLLELVLPLLSPNIGYLEGMQLYVYKLWGSNFTGDCHGFAQLEHQYSRKHKL